MHEAEVMQAVHRFNNIRILFATPSVGGFTVVTTFLFNIKTLLRKLTHSFQRPGDISWSRPSPVLVEVINSRYAV